LFVQKEKLFINNTLGNISYVFCPHNYYIYQIPFDTTLFVNNKYIKMKLKYRLVIQIENNKMIEIMFHVVVFYYKFIIF